MATPLDLSQLDDETRRVFEQLLAWLGPLREQVIPGLGSPEGVVTATRAIYIRLDGGAGTTLYVKESGTGNTGWVGT
jgi:hypothetical protein